MIRRQRHIVHFIGQQNIIRQVHHVLERYARFVLRGAGVVGSTEMDPIPLPILIRKMLRYTSSHQDVAKQWALPKSTSPLLQDSS